MATFHSSLISYKSRYCKTYEVQLQTGICKASVIKLYLFIYTYYICANELSIINIRSQYPRNIQTPQIFMKGCSKIVLARLLLDRFIGNTQ